MWHFLPFRVNAYFPQALRNFLQVFLVCILDLGMNKGVIQIGGGEWQATQYLVHQALKGHLVRLNAILLNSYNHNPGPGQNAIFA